MFMYFISMYLVYGSDGMGFMQQAKFVAHASVRYAIIGSVLLTSALYTAVCFLVQCDFRT